MTGPPVILPPFDEQSALRKVQVAQDAWNTRDPERVALAYTEDSQWRNRDEFFTGREAIKDFLRRKWARELDYVLRKELWCYQGNRISVRFEYESHDPDGPVVAQPRQRALGVRRGDRAHAPPRREHQRLPHRGERAADRHRLAVGEPRNLRSQNLHRTHHAVQAGGATGTVAATKALALVLSVALQLGLASASRAALPRLPCRDANETLCGDGGPADRGAAAATRRRRERCAGGLLIADTGNNAIRRVLATGVISTPAGLGTPGYSGDGGPAVAAQLKRARRRLRRAAAARC